MGSGLGLGLASSSCITLLSASEAACVCHVQTMRVPCPCTTYLVVSVVGGVELLGQLEESLRLRLHRRLRQRAAVRLRELVERAEAQVQQPGAPVAHLQPHACVWDASTARIQAVAVCSHTGCIIAWAAAQAMHTPCTCHAHAMHMQRTLAAGEPMTMRNSSAKLVAAGAILDSSTSHRSPGERRKSCSER